MFKTKEIVYFALLVFVFYSMPACENNLKTKEKTPQKSIENELPPSPNKMRWNNPMLTPFGKDIVSIIRGYFLSGDYDKMVNFLIIPKGYNKEQLEQIIRKSTWGYELKVTNINWNRDSSFINYSNNYSKHSGQ